MTINRIFDVVANAWEYADSDVSDFAILWILDYRFNLADFDSWINERACSPARRLQIMQWRQRAIEAQRAGNDDAAEGWVRFLGELRQRDINQGVLIPHAERDLASNRRQSARRKGKPTDDPDDTNRNDRLRRRYARLVQEGRHDATAETASEFNLSTRQVRRIVRTE
jgi:hypothetical protein